MVVVRVHRAARGSRRSRSRKLPFVRAAQRSDHDTHLLPHRGDSECTSGRPRRTKPRDSQERQEEIVTSHEIPCSAATRPEDISPVLTNLYHLAVRPLSKLVDDQVSIVSSKVVKKHQNFEAHIALQVTLAVCSTYKPVRDMFVVSDFRNLRLTLYEHVTANVAPSGIIIFQLLAGTKALRRSICPKNRYDFRFPHNKRVKELGKRVLSDFHHDP